MVAFSVGGDPSQVYLWDQANKLLYHTPATTGQHVQTGGGCYFSMDSATFANVAARNTIIS